MNAASWLFATMGSENDAVLAETNEILASRGLRISREGAEALLESRSEALAETERVEFGVSAITVITEAVASSPYLSQGSLADDLSGLIGAFYAIRDEMPVDVPDAEIADALRNCLDACGDIAEVASLPTDEVMRFSNEYVRAAEAECNSAYRIVDDGGNAYVFDPAEWEYDELARGWDGERWTDGWND